MPFDSPCADQVELDDDAFEDNKNAMSKSQTSKSETASPRATYQDVLDAPPHIVAEIVDDTLYTHPRPAPTHGEASSGLMGCIVPPFRFGRGGPGGWRIHFEPELHLGEDIVVPDIAGWRRERMSELPKTAFFTLAPDWVCEILSPSTRKFDLGDKRAVYAREGVDYLWLVDPDARSLEVLKLRGIGWLSIDKLFDEATVSLPPFEAIGFNLGDLWPPHAVHKGIPANEQPNKPTAESASELFEAAK